jgi:hypothetical protein
MKTQNARNERKKVAATNNQSTHIKRSKIMNASRCFRLGIFALMTVFLVSSIVLAGDFKNAGTVYNKATKTFTVANGNFQNYNAAAGKVYNAGSIQITGANKDFLNGNAVLIGYVRNDTLGVAGLITLTRNYVNDIGWTQNQTGTIQLGGDFTSTGATFVTNLGEVDYNGAAAQAVYATTYNILRLNGSGGNKTLGSGTTTASNTFQLAASNTVIVGTNTLNLDGTVTVGGALTSAATGTVAYRGAAQGVIPASYGNLTISGTATKTAASGSVGIASAYANLAGTTLSVVDLNLGAAATFAANLGTTKISGVATIAVPLTTDLGGTFDYAATTGTQTVASAQYTNLTISAAGGTGVTLNGTYYVSGNYTLSGSTTRTYTGSTVRFNGAGTQVITADLTGAYNNVDFFNTGEKQITGAVTVAGAALVDISVTGAGNNGVIVTATGSLTVNASGSLTNNGVLTNDGTITVN